MTEIDALKAVSAWLESWAKHVGNCPGGLRCECGLTRMIFECREVLDADPTTPLPAEIEGVDYEESDHDLLLEAAAHLEGPHEWGYRDPVEGGFISDPAPFAAASSLRSYAADLARLARPAASAEDVETVARIKPYDFQPHQGPMTEATFSVIARAIRASLRSYGHKVAESSLPECIATDVGAAIAALPVGGEAQNTCEMPEVAAMRYIEQLRADHGSVTILCDDEEAWTRDKQLAVDCRGEWTDWDDRRFYGESVRQCLAKAVVAMDEAIQRGADRRGS